jgi:hypothetical protein
VSSVRVFIAATTGPVEIQRITEEDPEVNSVVCLGGKAMPLPISAAYDAFVRVPTGVVQRYFGHAAYRADISATVEDGYSWQLGMFAAHGLFAARRLAAGDDPSPGAILVATGEVDRDLNVLPIDHLAVKLERLSGVVAAMARGGARVTIAIPAGNRDEIDEEWLAARRLGPGVCRVLPVGTVEELFRELELDPPAEEAAHPIAVVPGVEAPTAPRTRTLALVAAGLAAAVLVVGIAASAAFSDWRALGEAGRIGDLDKALNEAAREGGLPGFKARLFETWLRYTRPADGSVEIQVREFRAPGRGSCAAVRFGSAKAEAHLVAKSAPEVFETGAFEGLCGLEIAAEAGSDDVYLWGRFERRMGGGGGAPDDAIVLGPNSRSLKWEIDLPRRLPAALNARLVVIAARHPLDGAEGWLGRSIPAAGAAAEGRAWYDLVARLNARGVTVVRATYRVGR